MSTVADLPASAKLLTGPSNAWQGNQDAQTREESHTWKVPWSVSNAFYAAVVGSLTTISYGSGASISRRIPLQHPYNPTMWASRLSWRGIDSPHKPAGAPYAWVIVTITFTIPSYSLTTDASQGGSNAPNGAPPFCRISAKGSSRTVTDPSRQYTYSSGGGAATKLDQNVGIQCGGVSYQVTLFAIPDLGAWETTIDPLCGKVNSQVFQIGSFQRQPGTLLLEGYGWEEDEDVVGNRRWTGTIDLVYSSLPWNSIYYKGTANVLDPKPYLTDDLNKLFF